MTTTNTQGAAILCEHEDGRYAVNPDTTGDPAWHRLGPVDISALAASAQSGLTDAYAGAREDLSTWKRRALEAERDLRSEKQTTSRLVGELNAANGPAYMGEPAASPADTVVLEAALRAIHQAIDLIGEPDTERLRTVRRVLRGAVVVAEDCKTPQADSQPAPDEIINMAREQGLPETETEGVFIVNVDDLGRIFASYRAARAPADPQLLKFYGVTTDAELIAAQARHIERLQAKLPQTQSFAPQRVREG